MPIKDQKGMALFTVLIIIAVVSLVSATAWFASSQEVLATERDEHKTQAYHYAHSGVEMAIGLIKAGYCDDMKNKEIKEFWVAYNGTLSEQEIENYNIDFTIELQEEDDKNIFIIESVGTVKAGAYKSAEVKSKGLRFKIEQDKILDGDNNTPGENSSDGDAPLALFANEGITINSSARIKGNTATNSINSNSVDFEYHGYINNGNLYIGHGGVQQDVVNFKGDGRGVDTNIPDGEILNLPAIMNYPMPEFPKFPVGLPNHGTLKTDPGALSGKVVDSNGKGVGGVSIYLSPAVPGSLAKTSIKTKDNKGSQKEHGTWSAYTGNEAGKQEGTVMATPVKDGYTFNPQSQLVTGPASNIDFEAVLDPGAIYGPVLADKDQHWSWLIDQDGCYDTISILGNRKLCVDLQGGTRTIRVKNLDISQGQLMLTGEGRLVIYVEKTFTIGGSSEVNYEGDYQSLNIYYAGSDKLTFAGGTKFIGSIFAEKADFEISGSNEMYGAIITGGRNFTVSGAADTYPVFLYAPHADLIVNGSGKIKGTAIVNGCTVSGGDRDAIAAASLPNGILDVIDWGADGPPSFSFSDKKPTPPGTTWRDRGDWSTK